ncbi:MAG TPA: hypothetical protein VJP78_09430 [Thermoleophilia bacterium]|nr:hypothetical protein [Thermoleophilia bacterium]
MAATYTLTDGTTSVSLLSTSGFLLSARGFQPPSIPEAALHGGATVVERYVLRVKGTSHDNVASQEQTFIKLLRQARNFHEGIWSTKPVYLQAQTSGETSARYAMVYGAPELEHPSGLDVTFKLSSVMQDIGLAIEREHPWRSAAPNTLPTALTLGASDGPASPTLVHISNFRDQGSLSHVFSDDGGAFSGNLISAAAGTALFPAVPVAGDALWIISDDIAFKHVVFDIETASTFSMDLVVEYYNGGQVALVYGTDYTLWRQAFSGIEVPNEDYLFGNTGQWVLSIFPKSDWTTQVVNGVTGYAIKIRVNAFTSGAQPPTKTAATIYAQRKPYVEIPAASIKGDSPMIALTRLSSPSGGGSAVSPTLISRVLYGVRTNPASGFEPFLNCGNLDNPAAWTTAYGTDTSSVGDNEAPGRAKARITYATVSTSAARITLTGDDLLASYAPGEYRVFVRCQQTAGNAGDCKVSARIFIGGTAVDDPHIDLSPLGVEMRATGQPEVLDLGMLQLPFSRAYNSDSLASTDFIVEIWSERVTGISVLSVYDVILLPIDEGSVGADDPVTDTTNGSSALRGGCSLDIDAGVLANRTLKQIVKASTSGLVPAEEWGRMNRPYDFKAIGVKTRLYFLLLHYSSAWDTEPLAAKLGSHLACQVYGHYCYQMLRGAD